MVFFKMETTIISSANNALFCCPKCQSSLNFKEDTISCSNISCLYNSNSSFNFIQSQPILVDFEHSILEKEYIISSSGNSLISRPSSKIREWARNISYLKGVSIIQKKLRLFLDEVKKNNHKPRILIVGGATVGLGIEGIYKEDNIEIISFDIYSSEYTNFIADAHSIPLKNNSIDGIIIQSVLEHVLDPQQVVSEITRVLKEGGIVFSDTPFLQQVHEGPYDFTRFTESGHRWLFRNYSLIDSGVVFGFGTTLIWTIKYLINSVTRSRKVATILSFAFIWLQILDYLIPNKYAIDMASSFYFIGKKSAITLSHKDIIRHYKGSQNK